MSIQGNGMALRYIQVSVPGCAIVPIVPKVISVSAVERNRIRRVVQEELRRVIPRVREGVFGVVIIKKNHPLSTDMLRRNILALLEKSAILNK